MFSGSIASALLNCILSPAFSIVRNLHYQLDMIHYYYGIYVYACNDG